MKFKEGNKIPYIQDFRFFRGIPAGIDFKVEKLDIVYKLTAPGYGDLKSYGNGAIYVRRLEDDKK